MIRKLLERWALPDIACPGCGGNAWFIQRPVYAVKGLAKRQIGVGGVCAGCGQAAVLRAGAATVPGWASDHKGDAIAHPGASLSVLRRDGRDEKPPKDPAAADEDMPWKRKP